MWISLLIVAFLWSLSLQFGDTEANEKVCVLNLWFFFLFVKEPKISLGETSLLCSWCYLRKCSRNVSLYSVVVYCNSAPVTCYANFSQAIKNEWFTSSHCEPTEEVFRLRHEPEMWRKNLRQSKGIQPLLGWMSMCIETFVRAVHLIAIIRRPKYFVWGK